MEILVIEDDKFTLNVLMHTLKNLGHTVDTAENAEIAISKIEERSYDLILSDIMMPGISGLSLLTILRTVHLVRTPIIVMSALSNQELLDAAFEAGANDFIAKPFALEVLKEKLEKHGKATAESEEN